MFYLALILLFPKEIIAQSTICTQNTDIAYNNNIIPLLENYDIRGAETDYLGRLWLASSGGLLFFDGHNVFSPVKLLQKENISNILIDSTGSKLWIYTQSSFGILDLQTMKYCILKSIKIKNDFWNASIKADGNNRVASLFPDNTFCMFNKMGKCIFTIGTDSLLDGMTAT